VDEVAITRPGHTRWHLVGVVAALVGLALTVYCVCRPGGLGPIGRPVLIGLAWVWFTLAVGLVRRLPVRAAVVAIVAGGVTLPLLAATQPPSSSDDLFRYVWDGRVQASGVNPYRYAPAAPELVPLRDPVLWPADAAWCVGPGTVDAQTGQPLVPGCTRINRPAVHTIYPPVAQAYFAVVHSAWPSADEVKALQVAAALAAIAVTAFLLVLLPRVGVDPRRAALWAWCPTVAIEAGNNAHVDVVAALLVTAALFTASTAATWRSAAAAGSLLGLAVATKLTPALVGPAMARRRPKLLVGAATAAIGAVYLPHVLAVGAGVFGYLPGYIQEEGYADGSRFDLLRLLVPGALAAPAAALLLAGTALAVARVSDPDRPWSTAVVLTGIALLATTPTYPWYALLLVLLVAFSGRVEWLAVAAAGYVAFYAPELHLTFTTAHRLGYGAALLAVVATTVARNRPVASARRNGGVLTSRLSS
jgi:hypothetical protein